MIPMSQLACCFSCSRALHYSVPSPTERMRRQLYEQVIRSWASAHMQKYEVSSRTLHSTAQSQAALPPRRTRKPSHYLPLHAHSKSPLFPSLLKHLSQLSPLKSLGHFHLLPHFRHITLKHFIVASQSSQLLHHHFITHITG